MTSPPPAVRQRRHAGGAPAADAAAPAAIDAEGLKRELHGKQRQSDVRAAALLVALFVSGLVFLGGVAALIEARSPPQLAQADAALDSSMLSDLRRLEAVASADAGTLAPSGLVRVVGRIAMSDKVNATQQFFVDAIEALNARPGGHHIDLSVFTVEDADYEVPGIPLSYADALNVMARVRCSGCADDAPTVLYVSHTDSVAYSAGASDNGGCNIVLLTLLRLITESPAAVPRGVNVIFLFDDAEEGALIGARRLPRHPWIANILFFVNIDSAGGWGNAMLTRMNPSSPLLARIYSAVPHPYASAIASDLFSKLPSDTDFQVLRAAGLPGLDISFIGDTRYHTPGDTSATYRRGTLVTMLANLRALLDAADASQRVDAHVSQTVTFYDVAMRSFVYYDADTAGALYAASAAVALLVLPLAIAAGWRRSAQIPIAHTLTSLVKPLLVEIIRFPATVALGALAGAAFQEINMSLYATPALGVAVFWAWALAAAVVVGVAVAPGRAVGSHPLAETHLASLLAVASNALLGAALVVLHAGGLHAGYLVVWWTCAFAPAMAVATAVLYRRQDAAPALVLLWLTRTALPGVLSADTIYRLAAAMSPMLDRFGADSNAAVLYGGICALLGAVVCAPVVPTVRLLTPRGRCANFCEKGAPLKARACSPDPRSESSKLAALIAVLLASALTSAAMLPALFPAYTPSHAQRVDVLHVHYTDTGESFIKVGAPNRGALRPVVAPGGRSWTPCAVETVKYAMRPGLCLEHPHGVPPPAATPPAMHVSTAASGGTGGAWNATVTVTAADVQVWVLKFNGTLRSWSLGDDVMPRPGGIGPYLALRADQMALVRRARTPTFTVEMTFDEASHAVEMELWASFHANTPLQREIIQELPSTANVWSKSNLPGPVLFRSTRTVARPSA